RLFLAVELREIAISSPRVADNGVTNRFRGSQAPLVRLWIDGQHVPNGGVGPVAQGFACPAHVRTGRPWEPVEQDFKLVQDGLRLGQEQGFVSPATGGSEEAHLPLVPGELLGIV